jgi:hypothetical protein
MSEHCQLCPGTTADFMTCPGFVCSTCREKDAEIAALKAKLESAEEYAYKLNCRIARANGVVEQLTSEKAAQYDCHAGPGTTLPACGGCITFLLREIDRLTAATRRLVEASQVVSDSNPHGYLDMWRDLRDALADPVLVGIRRE